MNKNEYLINLITGDANKLWCGIYSPFSMDSIDFTLATNYRISSALHRKYDQVWFYETPLDYFDESEWRLIVDELIRLLRQDGIMVVRIKYRGIPSLIELKSFLGRRMNTKCELVFEDVDSKTNMAVSAFKIRRVNEEIYLRRNWSFIMLTLGNKKENVLRFLNSVRTYENDRSEIIIVGPPDKAYSEYDVIYANWSEFKDLEYAEICRKKNTAIDMAGNENVLILHDRYVLDKDFFSGFEKFGYDYDFGTVLQRKPDGREFPSYKAVSRLYEYDSYEHVDYQKVYDTSFVNGGCIVAKKSIIKEIGFNNNMFWDQMEDVELSHQMIERGIVPRINFLSHAISLDLRGNYKYEEKKTNGYNFKNRMRSSADQYDSDVHDKINRMLEEIYSCGERSALINHVYTESSGINDTDIFEFGLSDLIRSNNFYIFGTGKYSKKLYEYLMALNGLENFQGFIESKPESDYFCGYTIRKANDIDIDRKSLVIVGVSDKWASEVELLIKTIGFEKYVRFDKKRWRVIFG